MTLRIPLQKIIKSQRKKSREDQKKKQLQNNQKNNKIAISSPFLSIITCKWAIFSYQKTK